MPQTPQIVALDPGLAACGMVRLAPDGAVAAVETVRTKPTGRGQGADAFAKAEHRAQALSRHVCAQLAHWDTRFGGRALLVVEAFTDQPGVTHTQPRRDRWKAPLALGVICTHLREAGYVPEAETLVFQRAAQVFRAMKDELTRLEDPVTRLMVAPGSELLTNEHLRAAWAHAMWRYRLQENPPRP